MESDGIPGSTYLEFRSPVEYQVQSLGVQWNSRSVELGGAPESDNISIQAPDVQMQSFMFAVNDY